MSLEAVIKAFRRSGPAGGDDGVLQTNEEGDLFVAQGNAAPYTEITRRGATFNAMSAAAAPLVAKPTTVCIFELYNNTEDRVMEIQDLFLFHLLYTAALHNQSLWACVVGEKAAPSLAASITIGSQSGEPPVTATAASPVVPGAATTVIANGWRPWGFGQPIISATTLPGEAFSVPVDGKLLVPPRRSLAISVVDSLATGSSVQVGASWALRKMAMG
ncbi:hypothetical protein LCGC14_0391440 [marine sediment metagenome]|uniref:Uncharacterized protein n=1 Tax=marine sediment metagenome TaxID=412755 RepID=A0A0F9W8H3_9ZZZZ